MLRTLLLPIALCASFVASSVFAAPAADFNGTWKGKIERPDGQSFELTYRIKVDGDKLTGDVEGTRGKITIEDGKVSGDGFTFNTSFNDNKILHEAKWADGKIKITVRSPRGDREYTLSRVIDLAGLWQTKITMPDGNELALKYDFKIDGEKLTGTVEGPRGKLDLKEGKVTGEEISYKITLGENDVTYEGKAADGKIKLKSRGGPFGDREYTMTRLIDLTGPWEAKFAGPDGNEIPLRFDFKVEGDKLIGTVDGPGGKVSISNGKISGDEVSFEADVGGSVIKHKGKLDPKEIKLTVNGFDNEWELTMKRVGAK